MFEGRQLGIKKTALQGGGSKLRTVVRMAVKTKDMGPLDGRRKTAGGRNVWRWGSEDAVRPQKRLA